MEIQPNLDEFKAIAKKGYRIPVFMDLTADCETPLSAYSKLAQEKPAFLFAPDAGLHPLHLMQYPLISTTSAKGSKHR